MATTSIPGPNGIPPVKVRPVGDPGSEQQAPAPVLSLREHIPTALIARLLSCVLATGDQTETTRAPFTGEELITYPISTESDVEEAFARAGAAQKLWASTPVAERARIIGRIHHAALDRQDELMDLLQLEAGKARYDAFAEAGAVAVYARYSSRTAPKVLGRHARKGVVPLVTKAYEVRHPRGIVGLGHGLELPSGLRCVGRILRARRGQRCRASSRRPGGALCAVGP